MKLEKNWNKFTSEDVRKSVRIACLDANPFLTEEQKLDIYQNILYNYYEDGILEEEVYAICEWLYED